MPNLVGTEPNQVPVNGMLGTAAFINTDQLPVSAPQQALSDTKITRVGLATENAIGNAGASKAINWATAQRQSITLDQNTTLTFSFTGCPVGSYLLKIVQDATGGRTVTWSTGTPGTTRWLGSVVDPALHSAASGVSFAQVYWDGALAWGNLARVGAL
jgi:hypothetical protein